MKLMIVESPKMTYELGGQVVSRIQDAGFAEPDSLWQAEPRLKYTAGDHSRYETAGRQFCRRWLASGRMDCSPRRVLG